MRTIVVSGAHSNVGKTTLARRLAALLPEAARVKIGHGEAKDARTHGDLYHLGTSFAEIASRYSRARYLIVESNSVLGEHDPDLAIFLTGNGRAKPSAHGARSRADIVRGALLTPSALGSSAERLGVDVGTMRKIVWLTGARPVPTSAIVLAGGRSTRMGKDKSRLPLNGVPMIEHLAGILRPYFDYVMLSVAETPTEPLPRGMQAVVDRRPGLGPLMGITSALAATTTTVSFVIACDIPNVNTALLSRLLCSSEDCDIAVPSFEDGLFEPLYAVYRRAIVPIAERALEEGRRRVSVLFDRCRTRVIQEEETSWYVNMNTPHDYTTFIGNGEYDCTMG